MSNVNIASNTKTVSTYVVLSIMLFSSIALMFLVKYTVYNLQREILTVELKINKNIEDMRILEAEWAYLTTPERIRGLVNNIDNFKDYSQVEVRQIKDPKLLQAYYVSRNEKYGNSSVAMGSGGEELYY